MSYSLLFDQYLLSIDDVDTLLGLAQTLTGEGLLARAILHECDHLVGHMFTEMVEGDLMDVSEMAPEEEEEAEEGAETAKTGETAAEE